MAKKLYLTFESMSGNEKSIAVSLPKPNLTKETIEAAANVLISKNAMAGNWLMGAKLVKAEYKESVTDVINLD